MSTANARLQIAEAHLNALGPPKEGEDPEITRKRAHYEEQRKEALAQIGEATRERQPYKDGD